jgi:hypothetical protein
MQREKSARRARHVGWTMTPFASDLTLLTMRALEERSLAPRQMVAPFWSLRD